jgi:magnesium transporter
VEGRVERENNEPAPMTLTASVFSDGVHREEEVPLEQISDLLEDRHNFVWVDAVSPTAADIAILEQEFGLHPLAVEDALNAHQRPKLDHYEGYVFVVAYAASLATGRVRLHELGMFVAANYAITIRHDPPFDIAGLHARLDRAAAELRASGGAFVAYAVLEHIVDGYFDVIATLQDRLEQIEESLVWSTSGKQIDLSTAYQVRRDVIYFRRVVAPLREVFNSLVRRDEALFDHELDEYFRDLYDHVIRVYEELDTDRDLLAAALEDHLSVVSNRLNTVVLKVSAWAAIIAVPTFIASLYGMNFRHIPELSWGFGYGYALLLMAATGGALYAFLKHRKWL